MRRPRSKATRSGARLGSYRSGDRSEYLAAYALSRVAYVDPIPRQEDFGIVDFLCVLARTDSGYVYPESAFYVQVKSNTDAVDLSDVEFKWLADHMEHPLFVCVVDKAQSQISVYSCIPVWHAVFGFWKEHRSIRIKFGGVPGAQRVEKPQGSVQYIVSLGLPILQQTIPEIEAEPKTAYAVFREWITLDAANIARRRVGRVVVTAPVKWVPNAAPLSELNRHYFFGPGGYELVEKDLAPILTALAFNYFKAKKELELTALRGFLARIRHHLDKIGLDFADGKQPVE